MLFFALQHILFTFNLSLSTDKLESFYSILYPSLTGYSLHYYWSVLVVVLICSSNCLSSAIQFEDRLIPCRPDFSRQTFLTGNGYIYILTYTAYFNPKAANLNEILTSVVKIKFHLIPQSRVSFLPQPLQQASRLSTTLSTLRWSRHVPETRGWAPTPASSLPITDRCVSLSLSF